jgi:hypothetical protein
MVVQYRFNQRQVSLERMFELDPRVRDWLNSIVVENYPWPAKAPNSSGAAPGASLPRTS